MTPDAPAAQGAPDNEALYQLCKDTEKGLERLATGLGQIGLDPKAVDAVGKMADVIGQITNGLAKSMKEQPAEPAHTIDSAAEGMMADHNAARQAQQAQA